MNSNSIERKFTEQLLVNDYEVLTEDGFKSITCSNKTIKYDVYEIILENNISIKCADTHIFIKSNGEQIFAIDSDGEYLKTINGYSKVISVLNLGYKEEMYDLSIDSDNCTYYTNNILSHNTVSVAVYFCWLSLFEKDINIGVAAQNTKLSKEVLNKIKEIFINLPNWLTPGIKSWNKLSVSFENGINILSDYANSSSFRGFSMSYTLTDEAAYITGSDNGTSRFEAYLDAMLPSQSSLSKKKNIFISTANGMNSFERLYSGAKTDNIEEAEGVFKHTDTILLETGEIITIKDYFERINNVT